MAKRTAVFCWTLTMNMFEILILILVLALVFLAILFYEQSDARQIKKAGKKAEQSVQKDLKQILLKDDLYFSNVNVVYGKQKTELDNLIVNRNGIFIVEVKSYSGELYGIREDRQWLKQRFSGGGKLYQKHVDNPIGQVKRQEFILSRALKEHGISAWVTGYIYFTNHNAPFADDYFIDSYRELKQIIHSRNDDPLTKKQILQIKALIDKKKLQ